MGSWEDDIGKIIILYGVSGRIYQGRLIEIVADNNNLLLELRDGYVEIPVHRIEAVAWEKDQKLFR
jgi:hypothetical protein